MLTSDNQVFDWASFKLYRIENDKETEITPFTVQHDGNDAKTFTATLPSDAGEYQYRIVQLILLRGRMCCLKLFLPY